VRGTRSRRRFTRAQEEAAYRLTLEGNTAAETCQILREVGFERVPPFAIGKTSVQRIARERRETPAELALEAAADPIGELLEDAVRICRRALSRLEAREAVGKLSPREMRGWIAALRVLRQELEAARAPDSPRVQAVKPEHEPDDLSWMTSPSSGADASQPTQRAKNTQQAPAIDAH